MTRTVRPCWPLTIPSTIIPQTRQIKKPKYLLTPLNFLPTHSEAYILPVGTLAVGFVAYL